jgi:transposase
MRGDGRVRRPGPDGGAVFAALDMATGKVIGQTQRRHRHQEFLRFLKTIDKATPPDLDLHLILDDYSTHKTPQIHQWLLRHPRFHLHFTPAYSSWLNMVERWFAELTNRKLRRSEAVRMDPHRRRDPRRAGPASSTPGG